MGRKKIYIKLIKNERLRNITYNKRKRGLLKKMVELSIMCGIKAKLEIKDTFGNVIVLDSGQNELLKPSYAKDRTFVFTAADYPDFKGFDRLKKKNLIEGYEKYASDIAIDSSKIKPKEQIAIPCLSASKIYGLSGYNNVGSAFQPVKYKIFEYLKQHPQELSVQPAPSLSNHMDNLAMVQAFHLQSQLQYAQLRYQSLLSSFMNGCNF